MYVTNFHSMQYYRIYGCELCGFRKVFHSNHPQSLCEVPELYGIQVEFISYLRSLYRSSGCCVKTEMGTAKFFDAFTGDRQGCILLPLLFLPVVDFVMHKATEEENLGMKWTGGQRLTDVDFADDIALLTGNEEDLQWLTTRRGSQKGWTENW